MTAIDVQLRPEWVETVGDRYDVILDGEVIVHQSRDPEYEAARVLQTRGLTGKFRTVDFRNGRPRMILDIEKAAKLRTIERDHGGLSIEPHLPMSADDRTRLRPPSLYQGGVIRGGTLKVPAGALQRAGGERVVASRRSPEEPVRRPAREEA